MKICRRGLEYMQAMDCKGNVGGCCWSTIGVVGNLLENSVKEIYHGERLEKFRESLINGTYTYCNAERCIWMANGTLNEHLVEIDEVPDYPKLISMSYENECNYVCRCCRNELYKKSDLEIENAKKIEREISEALLHAETIGANGCGELFCSKSILSLLENFRPEKPEQNIRIELETNGSLFDEQHWKQISNLGKYYLVVNITIHSFEEKTYQRLSGTKLKIDNICKNLLYVKKLRDEGIINELELATVVQERNFREMPDFAKACIEKFGADRVRLRPFFPYGIKDKAEEWFNDVRNIYHPYHDEYVEVMNAPIMKNSKVYKWSGEEDSSIGKFPYYSLYIKNKENYQMMLIMTNDYYIKEKLEKYFKTNGIRTIVINGIGGVGETFISTLKHLDITIEFLIDNVKGKYQDYTIYRLEDAINQLSDKVVISTINSNINTLQKYANEVIYLKDLFDSLD